MKENYRVVAFFLTDQKKKRKEKSIFTQMPQFFNNRNTNVVSKRAQYHSSTQHCLVKVCWQCKSGQNLLTLEKFLVLY